MKKLTFFLFLVVVSFRTLATNYYVSASGNNTNDGKSETKSFLSIQKAADLTVAGDTVFVMNGVYNSISGPVLNITRSGTATGYITYKALKGHTPKITASGNVWNAVSINGSYIVFEGFELIGNNSKLTYAGALASYNEAKNGGTNWSAYANFNTNALTIGGPRTESKFPHHVTIRNCKVHDFPGGGINAIQTDYNTIENNVVYNNAWYMMYAGSGISILTPFNSDKVTTYKNVVRNNICFGNKTTIPWISQGKLSDGNGIIIDVNQHGYDNQNATVPNADEAYTGRTLVENNISVNNGGSGIHSYKADHVDIINNTAYHNGTVVGYSDVFANTCKDVNILNNIMYSRDGGECNSNNKNVDVRYDYNVYFNGKVAVKGPQDVIADPQFLNKSIDLAVANFTVKPTSPAVDKGGDTSGQFSKTDILGIKRPQGTRPDMGAYEFTGSNLVTGIASLLVMEKASLFPNPVKETLSIHLPVQNSASQIEILTCSGICVKKQSLVAQANEVNVEQLSVGLYIVVIYQNNQITSVHKFIKQD